MTEEYNQYQIIRKDAKGCFVESLNDAFPIGKVHFGFYAYDMSRPTGNRQTNTVHIYINTAEFLELCRKLECGELKYMLQQRKQNKDQTFLYEHLGGTSAAKMEKQNRARSDGKSLSRTFQITPGEKGLLLVAASGPGEENATGLIVPRFGNKPENHVTVSVTYDSFSELLLLTKAHYMAWLSAWYLKTTPPNRFGTDKSFSDKEPCQENTPTFF